MFPSSSIKFSFSSLRFLSIRVPARLPDSMAHVGLPVGSVLMTSEVAVGGDGASSLLDVARISGIFFALSGHLTTQDEQKKEKARVKALIAYFKALRNDQGARRRASNTRRGIRNNKSKRTNSRGHGQGRGKGPRRRRWSRIPYPLSSVVWKPAHPLTYSMDAQRIFLGIAMKLNWGIHWIFME